MDYTVTTSVFCTDAWIGFHRWPTAPDEVAYLRHKHRHKFNLRVEVAVTQNDREIEFHILRRQVESQMYLAQEAFIESTSEIDFGTRSCEALAYNVMDWLRTEYPDRPLYRVTVDEDGENGATVLVTVDE